MLLATFEMLVEDGTPITLALEPVQQASIPDEMAYLSAADPGVITRAKELARRALTLKFKLLQEAGKLKEAAEIGKIALEHRAKIKTRYMEVQVALGK